MLLIQQSDPVADRRPPNEWRAVLGLVVAVGIGMRVVIGLPVWTWTTKFIAWAPPFPATVPVGDHLQMAYYFWLWRHALSSGSHGPWLDAFQFVATGQMTHQPFGWPLVILSVPIDFVSGPVAAYNAIVFWGFLGSAVATALWLRELGASRSAAGVAGFAFAFAPFRVVQAICHVNAALAPLLPLTLFFVERAIRRDGRASQVAGWATVAAHCSLVASGELHLAVFGTALVGAYLVVRLLQRPGQLRALRAPLASLVLITLALVAMTYQMVLEPSIAKNGRSFGEAQAFAPHLEDIFRRSYEISALEHFAYPGTAVSACAMLGCFLGWRSRRWRPLAASAAVVGSLSYALAIIPSLQHHPWLTAAYQHVPFLGFSRVPGRILIVAALALSLLCGIAIDLLAPSLQRYVAAIMLLTIVVDVPAHLFRADAAPDALPEQVGAGNIVDLPPFPPGHYGGAGYALEGVQNPHRLTGGYSPFVTPQAQAEQSRTGALTQLPVSDCAWSDIVGAFNVRWVVLHPDLFGAHPLQWPGHGAELEAALTGHPAFHLIARTPSSVVYELIPGHLLCQR